MGGTPIFSFIFRFGALFLIKFQKSDTFGSMKICGFFFFGGGGGSLRNRTFLRGVISIHFRAF